MRPIATLIISLLLLPAVSRSQGPRKVIDDKSVTALTAWVDAVREHTPGRADRSVQTVAAFSYDTREKLNTGMGLFLTVLMGWPFNTDGNKAAETIATLGRGGDRSFLKRAAVLHSDVAAYGDISGVQASPERPRTVPFGEPISPLLMADRVILNKDGEVIGEIVSTWNWPFARSLLDLLGEGPSKKIFTDGHAPRATDPFVAGWYHATTAYMFASGLYGDATPHLHDAAEALPDDRWVLFDRACYAEILGLPMHQSLLTDPFRRGGISGPSWWQTAESPVASRLPRAEKTNAEAERLFRRALAVDPSLAEARVRLARLLELRGRYEEAADQLKTALEANPSRTVAFYAHLFAGRAAQVLGQPTNASRHYQGARTLFPDAQSALLASSQLALLQSDVSATLDPVQRLGQRSGAFDADPWWQYHLAAGRDAEDLLKALWASVPR